MHRLWFFVWVVQLCCASPQEEKPGSQKAVHLEESNTNELWSSGICVFHRKPYQLQLLYQDNVIIVWFYKVYNKDLLYWCQFFNKVLIIHDIVAPIDPSADPLGGVNIDTETGEFLVRCDEPVESVEKLEKLAAAGIVKIKFL